MKRQILLCVCLALAGLFVLLIGPSVIPALSKTNATVASNNSNGDNESAIQRGFDIAPVPLNLQGKNRALVGLGSYIVNAQGGCNDCHTNPPYLPGHDPFLGEEEQINVPCYLSGGTDFGPFRSRNLTPNSAGLPAGLTLEQFIHVLRTGEDLKTPFNPPFDGGRLQVMPWPVYGKMTDRDLKAVYEYLTTIPSRSPCLTPAP
jgi:hypothetical protein